MHTLEEVFERGSSFLRKLFHFFSRAREVTKVSSIFVAILLVKIKSFVSLHRQSLNTLTYTVQLII